MISVNKEPLVLCRCRSIASSSTSIKISATAIISPAASSISPIPSLFLLPEDFSSSWAGGVNGAFFSGFVVIWSSALAEASFCVVVGPFRVRAHPGGPLSIGPPRGRIAAMLVIPFSSCRPDHLTIPSGLPRPGPSFTYSRCSARISMMLLRTSCMVSPWATAPGISRHCPV